MKQATRRALSRGEGSPGRTVLAHVKLEAEAEDDRCTGGGESVLTGSRYGSLALFNLRASILTRPRREAGRTRAARVLQDLPRHERGEILSSSPSSLSSISALAMSHRVNVA